MPASETLWFSLPRNVVPPVECEIDGSSASLIVDGPNRGVVVTLATAEVHVRVEFQTQEDSTERVCVVNFSYPKPKVTGWTKVIIAPHPITVVFHFPLGIATWLPGRFAFPFGPPKILAAGLSVPVEQRHNTFWRTLAEYYWLPWGYELSYKRSSRRGMPQPSGFVPRRVVFTGNRTVWIAGSASSLYFVLQAQSIWNTVETFGVASGAYWFAQAFLPAAIPYVPPGLIKSLIVVLLVLALPILSKPVFKLVHFVFK